jgi:hypothetical protein
MQPHAEAKALARFAGGELRRSKWIFPNELFYTAVSDNTYGS